MDGATSYWLRVNMTCAREDGEDSIAFEAAAVESPEGAVEVRSRPCRAGSRLRWKRRCRPGSWVGEAYRCTPGSYGLHTMTSVLCPCLAPLPLPPF